MRIIGGYNKGRKLKSLAGDVTRPTGDKIRGAIFDCLHDVSDCTVLDVFGGSGALALEAVSRGAAKAVIVEWDKQAACVIENNIALCGCGDKVTLRKESFQTALEKERTPFELIFLDPPYGKGLAYEAMEIIRERKLLAERGIVVVETGGKNRECNVPAGFRSVKEKHYGDVTILFYRLEKIEV